tara:strand:+ start:46 stop:798 length:753 start_codon:yes stop_codon:yes gene_type:complete
MKDKVDHIVSWIKDYAESNYFKTLVVGVSGGIDSSVVSTLCSMTGLRTIPIVMTIKSKDILALEHAWWLDEKFNNVSRRVINLEKIFHEFQNAGNYLGADSELAYANSRSRLRMCMLYQVAQSENGLVVGTGNKVEDFGVGFYTKYGDGGVDISPLADCMKSEVYKMASYLNILQDIQDAPPTDGLWDDSRTDEDQIGMNYDELEACMVLDKVGAETVWETQKLERYRKIREQNKHKMVPIPVCSMEKFK